MSEEGDDREITLTLGEIKDTDNRIKALEGKLSEWNEIMNISIKGNIDERIMNLKKITDAQVIVNEYHSKGFNRLEKVLHKTLKKLADVGISGFIDEELLDALDSKLEKEETIKICPECHAYYKGTHTPTDCNYYKGNDSGGSKSVPKSEEAIYKTDKELMEDNPSTEKLPEPKDFYLGEKGFVVLNEKEAEPEKLDNDPYGIEGKYEHWTREELENECNVLISNMDAQDVLHLRENKELIEDAIKDLDELVAWSNNYPKDSEIYIRIKRKREKWQGKQK